MGQTTSVLARLSFLWQVKAVCSNYPTVGQFEHTMTWWRSEAMLFKVCSARPKMRLAWWKQVTLALLKQFFFIQGWTGIWYNGEDVKICSNYPTLPYPCVPCTVYRLSLSCFILEISLSLPLVTWPKVNFWPFDLSRSTYICFDADRREDHDGAISLFLAGIPWKLFEKNFIYM